MTARVSIVIINWAYCKLYLYQLSACMGTSLEFLLYGLVT